MSAFQRPTATRVAGLYAWNQLGRKVKKGEKGIRILAPIVGLKRKKDEEANKDITKQNPPYMALVIEATDESGPCGLPAISVCHYGEQNGDLMRDPEMCFELGFAAGANLEPYFWRNDYAGIEQWSRFIRDGSYVFHTALFNEHERFAKLWDNNLRLQGFAEAFERQQQTTRP